MSVQESVKTTFANMQERLSGGGMGDFTAHYLFDLGEEGGQWTVKIEDGVGNISEGADGDADCTVSVSADNFLKIVSKEANAQMMFMTGKLKVKGNMGLAMKLQKVLG